MKGGFLNFLKKKNKPKLTPNNNVNFEPRNAIIRSGSNYETKKGGAGLKNKK